MKIFSRATIFFVKERARGLSGKATNNKAQIISPDQRDVA